MTTACYRNGLLIADTRAFGFDKQPVGQKDKVFLLGGGALCCISTALLGVPALVLDWLQSGSPEDQMPNLDEVHVEILVVAADGSAEFMGGNLAPSRVKADYYTIGSGSSYALGALYLGHSAPDAVGVACALDPWTDFPLVGYTHDGERVTVRNRNALRRLWG